MAKKFEKKDKHTKDLISSMITPDGTSFLKSIMDIKIDVIKIRYIGGYDPVKFKEKFKFTHERRLKGKGHHCVDTNCSILGVYDSYEKKDISYLLFKPADDQVTIKKIKKDLKEYFTKDELKNLVISSIEIALDFKLPYWFVKSHFYVAGKKIFYSCEESKNNSTLKFGRGDSQTVLYDKGQESKLEKHEGITRIEVKLKGSLLPTKDLFTLKSSLLSKDFNPFKRHLFAFYEYKCRISAIVYQ